MQQQEVTTAPTTRVTMDYWRLSETRPCAKNCICIISLIFYYNLIIRYNYYPYFTDEKTDTRKVMTFFQITQPLVYKARYSKYLEIGINSCT